MRPLPIRLLALATLVSAVACGGAASSEAPSATAPPEPTGPLPAPPEPIDHGAPSSVYPAYEPDMARLVHRGGHVLERPVVVTVTWEGNPNATLYETLGDHIGATRYWKQVVGEYGVGPATSGPSNHVHLKEPVAVPTDPDADPIAPFEELVVRALSDPAASGWPAPTDQTVYTLYVSGAPALAICDLGAGGLHDEVQVNGKPVAFALVLECDGGPKMPALESATITASHELAEAALDPLPTSSPGWQGLDGDHLAWELMQMGQDENGDMCELYEDAYGAVGAPEMDWTLQRQWSNASAARGHSPCVPAAPEPYFNVAPRVAGYVAADLSGMELPPFDPRSRGVHLPVGESTRIPLGLYSDGPTEAFDLEVFEVDPFDPSSFAMDPARKKTLELALDKTSGKNGEKVWLTIASKEATRTHVALVVVVSKIGRTRHYMPLLVGDRAAPPPPREAKAWRGPARRVAPAPGARARRELRAAPRVTWLGR